MVILKLKIRLLKLKLEQLSGVKLVHPFIKPFDTIYTTSVSQSNSRNIFKKIVDNYGTHSLESFLVKKKNMLKLQMKIRISIQILIRFLFTTMIKAKVVVHRQKKRDG